MRSRSETPLNRKSCALPLRREVAAVMHIFRTQSYRLRVCLDAGFTHAGVSRYLRRQVGGFWATVEPTVGRARLVAPDLEEGTVFAADEDGELPFEDRQFDALVLAHGALPGGGDEAERVVRECHRVLKTGGLLLLTVEARKRLGLANLLNRNRRPAHSGGLYSEAEIFRLLKNGFDVLGFRYSCRFWVQLVRQWADRRRERGVYDRASVWLRALYGIARALDLFLFFTRGYQMTVCGRRKGWQRADAHLFSAGAPVSDAVLCIPRPGGRGLMMDKVK